MFTENRGPGSSKRYFLHGTAARQIRGISPLGPDARHYWLLLHARCAATLPPLSLNFRIASAGMYKLRMDWLHFEDFYLAKVGPTVVTCSAQWFGSTQWIFLDEGCVAHSPLIERHLWIYITYGSLTLTFSIWPERAWLPTPWAYSEGHRCKSRLSYKIGGLARFENGFSGYNF